MPPIRYEVLVTAQKKMLEGKTTSSRSDSRREEFIAAEDLRGVIESAVEDYALWDSFAIRVSRQR